MDAVVCHTDCVRQSFLHPTLRWESGLLSAFLGTALSWREQPSSRLCPTRQSSLASKAWWMGEAYTKVWPFCLHLKQLKDRPSSTAPFVISWGPCCCCACCPNSVWFWSPINLCRFPSQSLLTKVLSLKHAYCRWWKWRPERRNFLLVVSQAWIFRPSSMFVTALWQSLFLSQLSFPKAGGNRCETERAANFLSPNPTAKAGDLGQVTCHLWGEC